LNLRFRLLRGTISFPPFVSFLIVNALPPDRTMKGPFSPEFEPFFFSEKRPRLLSSLLVSSHLLSYCELTVPFPPHLRISFEKAVAPACGVFFFPPFPYLCFFSPMTAPHSVLAVSVYFLGDRTSLSGQGLPQRNGLFRPFSFFNYSFKRASPWLQCPPPPFPFSRDEYSSLSLFTFSLKETAGIRAFTDLPQTFFRSSFRYLFRNLRGPHAKSSIVEGHAFGLPLPYSRAG